MNEIERKALALLNDVLAAKGYAQWQSISYDGSTFNTALCRAIEQHEAFRQEVSGRDERLGEALYGLSARLLMAGFFENKEDHAAYERVVEAFGKPFIIPKPVDPLVEVIAEVRVSPTLRSDKEMADQLRAAMLARGYEFTKIGEKAGE